MDEIKTPLTATEKDLIRQAAQTDSAKPVTWARDILVLVAKRRSKKA
jgi:hypothetical protein